MAPRTSKLKPGTADHLSAAAVDAQEAARLAQIARLALEKAVVAYRAQGASLRAIGALTGMSPEGVNKMLRRNGVNA